MEAELELELSAVVVGCILIEESIMASAVENWASGLLEALEPLILTFTGPEMTALGAEACLFLLNIEIRTRA